MVCVFVLTGASKQELTFRLLFRFFRIYTTTRQSPFARPTMPFHFQPAGVSRCDAAPAPAPSAQPPRQSVLLSSIENVGTGMQRRLNLGTTENTQEGGQVELLTEKVNFLQSVVTQKDREITFGKQAHDAETPKQLQGRSSWRRRVEIASLKSALSLQSHAASSDGASTIAPPAPFASM